MDLGIIVHPFRIEYAKKDSRLIRADSARSLSSSDPYLLNIFNYLTNKENSAIILEDINNIDITQRLVKKFKGSAQLSWIFTRPSKAEPTQGWPELFREIDKIHPESLTLMGGFYIFSRTAILGHSGSLAELEKEVSDRRYKYTVDMKRTFS